MIYSYINTNKVVKETVDDGVNIVSVAYDEFCNYSSMLESCTDENERAILEAKCEVLYEVSFKDIIEKLKQMWEDFKAWVKKVWNAIFHNKKATDKVADDVADKVNKHFDDILSGKNKMKRAGVLSDLKVPVYYASEFEKKYETILGGHIMEGNTEYILNRILYISTVSIILDDKFDNDGKNIEIEKSTDSDDIKDDISKLQENIEKIDKISIELEPIVENKYNNVFMINNRLKHYGIKFDKEEVNEDTLRKVYNVYIDILEGFKHDYVKVYGYKTKIDKNISDWDRKVKQLLNKMHNEIDNYKKNSEEYANYKAKQDYIASYPYKDYHSTRLRGLEYDLAVSNKKHAGWKKHRDKNKTVDTHDSIAAIRDLIRNLQKATNAISGLSAKIVSAEQKTTVQLGKLDKIILDMAAKAEEKDDNEI